MTIEFINGNFSNTFFIVLSAGGFYVDNSINMFSFYNFSNSISIIGTLKIALLIISIAKDTTSYSNHGASA
jgi:hypothetical protein